VTNRRTKPKFEKESVQAGEKGIARLRRDKRIKKYLQSKRPPRGELLFNYRSEALLGANQAYLDGADPEVRKFLLGELDWAIIQLLEYAPDSMKRRYTADELRAIQARVRRIEK